MIVGTYEWDDDKAAANLAKHGIAFRDAIHAFSDPHGVLLADQRQNYGEDRMNLLAQVPGHPIVIIVCHVVRDHIRIISARTANRRERRRYKE